MNKILDWKLYYQKEAEVLDFDARTDMPEIHRCLAAWSVFPAGPVGSILDVGCGDGYFCHWVSRKKAHARIVGVDISEPRIDRARQRYPHLEFMSGEIVDLPFPDNEFDVVTCIEVLEHQPNPLAALRELLRIARKYVVVTVPDREDLTQTLCPHCLETFPTHGHIHAFDVGRLSLLAAAVGGTLEHTRSYHPPRGASHGIPRPIGRLLATLERVLLRSRGVFLAARISKTAAGTEEHGQ